jgi:hypothetical protein
LIDGNKGLRRRGRACLEFRKLGYGGRMPNA